MRTSGELVKNKTYEVNKEAIDSHILISGPETMSTFELVTSPGFIYMMSLILVPSTIVGVLLVKLIKRSK